MPAQYSLFADPALRLLSDDEGGLWLYPGVAPPQAAGAWFDALMRSVSWRSERRPMYDRIVDVPRLTASVALHDPGRPSCIDAALAAVQSVAPAPYTRAGLNLYRDGRDSVAMHNDRVHDLAPRQPIAILSLGAPRDMLIRPKHGVAGGTLRMRLEPGSVLVMSHASQFTHEHGIPKSAERTGARISVAFRVRT